MGFPWIEKFPFVEEAVNWSLPLSIDSWGPPTDAFIYLDHDLYLLVLIVAEWLCSVFLILTMELHGDIYFPGISTNIRVTFAAFYASAKVSLANYLFPGSLYTISVYLNTVFHAVLVGMALFSGQGPYRALRGSKRQVLGTETMQSFQNHVSGVYKISKEAVLRRVLFKKGFMQQSDLLRTTAEMLLPEVPEVDFIRSRTWFGPCVQLKLLEWNFCLLSLWRDHLLSYVSRKAVAEWSRPEDEFMSTPESVSENIFVRARCLCLLASNGGLVGFVLERPSPMAIIEANARGYTAVEVVARRPVETPISRLDFRNNFALVALQDPLLPVSFAFATFGQRYNRVARGLTECQKTTVSWLMHELNKVKSPQNLRCFRTKSSVDLGEGIFLQRPPNLEISRVSATARLPPRLIGEPMNAFI